MIAAQSPGAVAWAGVVAWQVFVQRVPNAHDHAALQLAGHQFWHDLRAAFQPGFVRQNFHLAGAGGNLQLDHGGARRVVHGARVIALHGRVIGFVTRNKGVATAGHFSLFGIVGTLAVLKGKCIHQCLKFSTPHIEIGLGPGPAVEDVDADSGHHAQLMGAGCQAL